MIEKMMIEINWLRTKPTPALFGEADFATFQFGNSNNGVAIMPNVMAHNGFTSPLSPKR